MEAAFAQARCQVAFRRGKITKITNFRGNRDCAATSRAARAGVSQPVSVALTTVRQRVTARSLESACITAARREGSKKAFVPVLPHRSPRRLPPGRQGQRRQQRGGAPPVHGGHQERRRGQDAAQEAQLAQRRREHPQTARRCGQPPQPSEQPLHRRLFCCAWAGGADARGG